MSVLGAIAGGAFDVFAIVSLAYLLLVNLSYLALTLLAFRSLRRYAIRLQSVRPEEVVRSAAALPVTLIAPAYNEAATCVESVRALLSLNYPDYTVLVVNDGSKDATVEKLREAYQLEPAHLFPLADLPTASIRAVLKSRIHPNLWVLDKANGGKADALNAGLNYCRTPLFCAMDADSLLERDALSRVGRAFLEDSRTVAVGGTIRLVNGCSVRAGTVEQVRLPGNMVARFQAAEYLRAFLVGRMGWEALESTLIISGAFGMFRRSAVVEAGGFGSDTVGEDMELVVRLHRHLREAGRPYRVSFLPDPVAWTEVPESLRQLGRQRDRWQRGLMETMHRHRRMLLNPRYGRIGMLAVPYYYFLEMCGPVIEALGFLVFVYGVLTGAVSPAYIAAFLSLSVVFGVALSLAAVGLEELVFHRYTRTRDLLHLFLFAVIENFGYRQLATFWRLRGIVSKLRNVRSWGEMERKGFQATAAGT